MGVNITCYSSKNSPEFQKHYEAVKFCIERGLSYPKETSEFFRGKINGDSLEDYHTDAALALIENGIRVDMPMDYSSHNKIYIHVDKIPFGCDTILIELK